MKKGDATTATTTIQPDSAITADEMRQMMNEAERRMLVTLAGLPVNESPLLGPNQVVVLVGSRLYRRLRDYKQEDT